METDFASREETPRKNRSRRQTLLVKRLAMNTSADSSTLMDGQRRAVQTI